MAFHVTGFLSSLFFLFNIVGLVVQLRKIYSRPRGRRTDVISLDQTFTTFLGYYALFVYGYSVSTFNGYLVWPRLIAIPLVLVILLETALERRRAWAIFGLAIIMYVLGIAGLISGVRFQLHARLFSQGLVVFLTILFIQSYIHQIMVIRKSGSVGAVSRGMYILGLLSDLANIVFGLLMGLADGWPLILDCGTTTILRIVLLRQFRWVRISPEARRRRNLLQKD